MRGKGWGWSLLVIQLCRMTIIIIIIDVCGIIMRLQLLPLNHKCEKLIIFKLHECVASCMVHVSCSCTSIIIIVLASAAYPSAVHHSL